MQYINDDMDELYRRAAEDYPLNTNSADWNAVVKKLSAKDPGKTADQKGNNYKRWLLLLLLLPAAWIGKEYFYSSPKQNSNPLTENVSNNKSVSPQLKSLVLEASEPATIDLVRSNPQPQQLNTPVVYKGKQIFKPGGLTSTINNPEVTKITNSSSEEQIDKVEHVTPSETIKKDDKPVVTITTTPEVKNEEAVTTVTEKKKPQQKQQGIYVGVVVSPDISTVKFQSIKDAGFSVGVLLGYQLNKKVSVESGLAWNKKYYHSDGKHFSTKNITLPAYAKIKELDGTCEMIEVPVTVRYNVRSSAKANLSVSAGMSSYIMKNENYNYTIERNGSQYPRSADYNNSSTDMFAVANVGVGYNRNLGKNTVLRLEPYIKIPVKGVGIGDIPIMSTGINLAITKKLFK